MSKLRILLDEQYAGLKEFLEALGWDVETAQDVGLKGAEDRIVVDYAKEHNLFLVTQDTKQAAIAKLVGVKHIIVNMGFIAKAIDAEIKEKYVIT